MTRIKPLLLACVLVSACEDTLSGPGQGVISTLSPATTQGAGCPPEVIICDGEPTVTYGTYTEDIGDISGTGEETYSMTAAEAAQYVGMPNGSGVLCPLNIPWVSTATFKLSPDELDVIVQPTGYTTQIAILGLSSARYIFPQNWSDSQGMWPDIGPGSPAGRYARAQSADGSCSLRPGNQIKVSFFRFNGVAVRYPTRCTSSGGGGGQATCHTEYAYLEINYGDGTGWHVIWQGYVTVCG